jgi:hypothetical protein
VDAAELERLAVAFLPELGAPAAEAVVAAPTAPVAAAAPPVLSVTDV